MKLPNKRLHATQSNSCLIVFFALLLTACGSPCPSTGCQSAVTINGKNDKLEWVPALRLGIDLGDGKQAASQPHTGHAIELGITQTRGSSTQFISGNERVVLNGNALVGPQSITDKFDFSFADLSYRWRKFPWESPLGFELSGGLGFPSLNLTVSSPTQRATGSYGNTGLQAGLGLIWRLNPDTSLQARMAGFTAGHASMDSFAGVDSITRYELSLAHTFGENLSLRAGFARWKISGKSGFYQSDFELRSYGPTLVLDWDFNARNPGGQRQPNQSQPDQGSNSY